jgi:MerR family transcriptional regulator/heat shock protein HspR
MAFERLMMKRGIVDVHEDQPRYVISIAARLVNVHPQTLRQYERFGLIEPKRTEGKIRLYSDRDLDRIRCVQRLVSELGVNLAGAEVILNMRERMLELSQQLDELQARLEENSGSCTKLSD